MRGAISLQSYVDGFQRQPLGEKYEGEKDEEECEFGS